MTGPTPLRAIRVPDDLWDAALRHAQQRGDTLSDVIRDALRSYLTRQRDDADDRR